MPYGTDMGNPTTTSRPSPSAAVAPEVAAFLGALEETAPDACCACLGWTAHELVAHLVAAATEVTRTLDAYRAGLPVPRTRGFEEREVPWRAKDPATVRAQLPRALDAVAETIDSVLATDPDAVVPWTRRQMVVASFVTHLRSELALHRWDLTGDDEESLRLLGHPELTDHAVSVLGRALLARGRQRADRAGPLVAALGSPGTTDVYVVADAKGARLTREPPARREGSGVEPLEPIVVGDPGARLLLLWGRCPGDPRRLVAPGGATRLAAVQALLAGY